MNRIRRAWSHPKHKVAVVAILIGVTAMIVDMTLLVRVLHP